MTIHTLPAQGKLLLPKPATKPIAVSNIKLIDKPGSSLKAVFTLTCGPITLDECKLLETSGKAWVSGPSFKEQNGSYKNPVRFDREYSERILAVVLEALR